MIQHVGQVPSKIFKALSNARPYETGLVVVDLGAIKRNYQRFLEHVSPTTIAPVIKADAYGLGMVEVGGALHEVGANEFFVATIDEAIRLKKALPNVSVYVLYGLYFNSEQIYLDHGIVPVLNTYEQVVRWNAFAQSKGLILECIIHFDTGMSRTGLTIKEGSQLANAKEQLTHIHIRYVMSHLSCSEVIDNPLNKKQHQEFQAFAEQFPHTKRSLTATPVMYMPHDFKMDMARVGYGLYGFCHSRPDIHLEQAIYIYSRIIQLRDVVPGDTVGYGATHVVKEARRLATLSIGYADGYHRFLHNYKTYVYIGSHRAYLVGRISMDFCVVDVSHIPEDALFEGAWVQMVGSDIRVADLIQGTDFVPHEIPISVGKRYHWEYLD
jgi:alanine racemase